MPNEYQIAMSGRITWMGTIDGANKEEAIETAKLELQHGEIEEVTVDSCIYIDPEPES